MNTHRTYGSSLLETLVVIALTSLSCLALLPALSSTPHQSLFSQCQTVAQALRLSRQIALTHQTSAFLDLLPARPNSIIHLVHASLPNPLAFSIDNVLVRVNGTAEGARLRLSPDLTATPSRITLQRSERSCTVVLSLRGRVRIERGTS